MNTPSPPRRPPGPPPARPPPPTGLDGRPPGPRGGFGQTFPPSASSLGAAPLAAGGGGAPTPPIKRPPGPPPRGGPMSAIKPPPMAPPPRQFSQTQQRPGVVSTRPPPPRNAFMSPPSANVATGLGATSPTAAGAQAHAPGKGSGTFPPAKPAKEGAIAMFEEPDEDAVPEPSDTKISIEPQPLMAGQHGFPVTAAAGSGRGPSGQPPPRGGRPLGPRSGAQAQDPEADPSLPFFGRGFRPAPPTANPPGIPDGQPLPPSEKPVQIGKSAAPLRAPPNRNRAPPNVDPEEEKKRKLAQAAAAIAKPPTTEPPLLRIKRKKEEPPLKRREKDMPEFESSDEDEEDPNFVKQPLPFGVLKQPLPASSLEPEPVPAEPSAVSPLSPASKKGSKEQQKKSVLSPDLSQRNKATLAPLGEGMGSKSGTAAGTDQHSMHSNQPAASKVQSLQKSLPGTAPTQTITSDLVPSAPDSSAVGAAVGGGMAGAMATAFGKHFDDSKLGKSLSRGRLSIKCVEGYEIRRKDDPERNPRSDPFIKFRLGVAERHPWKSTEVKRKQDTNPSFDDEIVSFDILDPGQYVFEEDMQICIELWNKSTLKDEKLGSVTMSVVRFLAKPFVSYLEKVPIYYPGATKTSMKVLMEFVFEEARTGLVQITLYEARGLRNIDPMGHQDPYVQFQLGANYKKRSKTIKDGGTDPYFEEEDVLMWVDQENWVDDLKVSLLDEDSMEEKPIGGTHFSVLPYMKVAPDDAREDTYDLFYWMLIDPKDDREKKEVACGEIVMRVRFMPAGKLSFFVDRAKDLQFPETHKPVPGQLMRMDPYATLTAEGKAVKTIKRTPADKDGGSDPIWEAEVTFEIVDQYQISLDVFNQNVVGKDELLGSTQVSLLAVFRNGSTEFWTTLKQRKANGGIKEVGDIFLRLKFEGPTGIAYPQFRPEVDSFDDTLRKLPYIKDAPAAGADGAQEEELDEEELKTAKPIISTVPDENDTTPLEEQARKAVAQQEKAAAEELPPEFTDLEIENAFKFIDLDHNNFVGAAEIRHILVCMGEMITDEEIDMMISMVDMDGDGQVSYKEFRSLVLHPNPGVVDMHKEINKEKDAEAMREKQAMAGKAQGLDLTAYQRQKEMTQREEKKRMIVSFVADNEVNFEYVRQAYTEFLALPREKRPAGRIKFAEFCRVLNVEPITEYKNLHAYYDTEELGDMDLREFLLSMMNFVHVDKEERIRFSFTMFDEAKSGYIAQKEVEEILRGNHMISIASVRRKAETIMKQAKSNKAGAITLNEFVVVSKKFPNILLPAIGLNNLNGNKNAAAHTNGNGNGNGRANGNANGARSFSTALVPAPPRAAVLA